MRIVVTGGAGFIGSHVVDLLAARGDEVVVLDDLSTAGAAPRPDDGRVRHHRLDIADEAAAEVVRAFRPEAMVLLAAQASVKVSMRDPLLDARTNVTGLINMLEAARQADARKVVFASSGGTVYGTPAASELPIAESHPHRPLSFYGLTKSAASGYLRVYREQYGLSYAALALGNVYGPRQRPDGEAGVVSIFAGRMLAGLPCVINGDGETTRDYVHVRDVADAFVRAVDRGEGDINIGTGVETSVREIHRTLDEVLGLGHRPQFGPPLAGEVARVALDPARAAEQLGWRPTVGLVEGARSVCDWLRAEAYGALEPAS
ncbi:NAD-dependent epimerase/dehydratase family protein [Streptomyces koyangensis]|uniref:NAD-dependent epimerase/dehydratase family protein n=1 Tax=Streptomyces koyangensis TaxID=188770 RepID=UPI003C2EB209